MIFRAPSYSNLSVIVWPFPLGEFQGMIFETGSLESWLQPRWTLGALSWLQRWCEEVKDWQDMRRRQSQSPPRPEQQGGKWQRNCRKDYPNGIAGKKYSPWRWRWTNTAAGPKKGCEVFIPAEVQNMSEWNDIFHKSCQKPAEKQQPLCGPWLIQFLGLGDFFSGGLKYRILSRFPLISRKHFVKVFVKLL